MAEVTQLDDIITVPQGLEWAGRFKLSLSQRQQLRELLEAYALRNGGKLTLEGVYDAARQAKQSARTGWGRPIGKARLDRFKRQARELARQGAEGQ